MMCLTRRCVVHSIQSAFYFFFFFFSSRRRHTRLTCDWSSDVCSSDLKAHPHPELRDQTVWEVFEAERPSLVPYPGRFDGFHAVPASVSKTCLVRRSEERRVGKECRSRWWAEY